MRRAFHFNVHTYMHTYMHACYIHIHTHIYIYIYMYTYMNICIKVENVHPLLTTGPPPHHTMVWSTGPPPNLESLKFLRNKNANLIRCVFAKSEIMRTWYAVYLKSLKAEFQNRNSALIWIGQSKTIYNNGVLWHLEYLESRHRQIYILLKFEIP